MSNAMLIEIPLPATPCEVPQVVEDLACEALRRSKKIDCFDFVPSSHAMVYRVLSQLPRGRWCEWGSGIGINTAIAAWLGHDAVGIELDPHLAEASKQLLRAFQLTATIHQGSYFDVAVAADYYYVYCWPSQMNDVEEHFLNTAPVAAKLLICHGAEDVRCKVRERVR